MRVELLSVYLFFLLLAACGSALAAEKAKDERVVKDGLLISLDYTLKSPEGKVLETSKGREPL